MSLNTIRSACLLACIREYASVQFRCLTCCTNTVKLYTVTQTEELKLRYKIATGAGTRETN